MDATNCDHPHRRFGGCSVERAGDPMRQGARPAVRDAASSLARVSRRDHTRRSRHSDDPSCRMGLLVLSRRRFRPPLGIPSGVDCAAKRHLFVVLDVRHFGHHGPLWLLTRGSPPLVESSLLRVSSHCMPRVPSNQAMQRTAGRSAFPSAMTSTLNPQPHAPSPAVADLGSR